jgi:hypothetical protein
MARPTQVEQTQLSRDGSAAAKRAELARLRQAVQVVYDDEIKVRRSRTLSFLCFDAIGGTALYAAPSQWA